MEKLLQSNYRIYHVLLWRTYKTVRYLPYMASYASQKMITNRIFNEEFRGKNLLGYTVSFIGKTENTYTNSVTALVMKRRISKYVGRGAGERHIRPVQEMASLASSSPAKSQSHNFNLPCFLST